MGSARRVALRRNAITVDLEKTHLFRKRSGPFAVRRCSEIFAIRVLEDAVAYATADSLRYQSWFNHKCRYSYLKPCSDGHLISLGYLTR